MTSIAYSPVSIQTSVHSVPTPPSWFGEIILMAHHLQRQEVLAAIEEQVRFARRRFGRYEVIDFVAVLFGYAVSSERTRGAPFTSRSTPGPARSWRSLGGTVCLHVRHSAAFLPRSIRPRSRPCDLCF